MRQIIALILVAIAFGLPACDGGTKGRLEKIGRHAAAAGATRATVSADVLRGFKDKSFSAGDAIDMAYTKLEAAAAGSTGSSPDPKASADATMIAGGVLDAITSFGGTLPQGGEFEIFWMRVGRLAFKASEEAFANARLQEAASLMLGGGNRWQNENYWQRYSDHDGLVSAIMAASGDRAGAIRRLESRNDLNGPAAEVLETLKKRQ